MTLEDGEKLDSRQSIDGDQWSSLAQRTMAGSQLWWVAASSLVNAIIDDGAQDSFALVVGPRVLVELAPDGRLRKRQLRHFFKGRVSNLEIGFHSGQRKRRSPYQPVGAAPWDEGLQLEVDFGEAGTRWRLLQDGAEFLPHVLPAIRPAVVVDVDAVPLKLPYREYEAGHLQANTTLVLPHSEAAERHVRDVLEWRRIGRPPQENDWAPELDPSDRWLEIEQSRRQIPIEEAAVVSTATFGVTGLYRDGDWRDPADLEAARAFTQGHADLRIGIWDLVKSPSLREGLLQPTSVPPVPMSPASTPTGSARRASEYEMARDEDWEREQAFRGSLENRFEELRLLGWTSAEQDDAGVVTVVIGSSGDFLLPLTEPVLVEGKATPLAWLALTLNKRSTRVDLHVAIWGQFKVVRPYLEARSARFSEIAGPGKWEFGSPIIPILWEEKGGWGDDIDWPSRVARLSEQTREWLNLLSELSTRLVNDLRADDEREAGV